ncbi:MAG TPA: hypothetical protein VGE94_10105, partial [Chloroflexota bacterium]
MRTHGLGARVLLAGGLFLTACSPSSQPAAQQPAAPAQPTPATSGQQQQQPQQPQPQPAASSGGGSLVFFSNQFKPVEEQSKMQDIILKNAPLKADYIPEDPGPFNDRLNAEERTGKVTVSLIGGLHGDLDPFVKAGYLEDLTPLAQKLSDRGIAPAFMDLAHLGSRDKTYYIPWMQATYVLAINNKAMPYL